MSKQIQEKIKKLEDKKNDIEKEISSLKLELNNESDNVEWISLDKEFEVTKEVLHKGKSFNQIMQLKKPNEELLTLKQIAIILKNSELTKELKMDCSYSTNDDFFIQQPFKTNKEKGYVAEFYSGSNGSDLYFDRGADVSYRARGVRFVRKKVKKVNK